MRAIFTLLILSLCSLSLGAETQRFYDKNGSPLGRADTSRNVTRYYDRNGSPLGSARTNSWNTETRFYDRNGSPLGSSRGTFNPKTSKTPYIKQGKK